MSGKRRGLSPGEAELPIKRSRQGSSPRKADASTIPFPVQRTRANEPPQNSDSRVRTSRPESLGKRPTIAPSDSDPILLRKALEDKETAVLSDTVDFETLSLAEPHGSFLTPEGALEQIGQDDVYYHLWVAVKRILEEGLRRESDFIEAATEQYQVELGKAIIDRAPNSPHFTFIDARLHNDYSAIILKARRLIRRFEQSGVPKSRVVVSIPATECGVLAARTLADVHCIQTNLMLVSGLLLAEACAEAHATTVCITVGPTLQWHAHRRRNTSNAVPEADTNPGLTTIQSIITYFRLHKISTKLIGTDFRKMSEIAAMGSDLDALSLTCSQLAEVKWNKTPLSHSMLPEASFRATQAKAFPMGLLPSPDGSTKSSPIPAGPMTKKGFMSGMSATTRSMIAATLYVAIGDMSVQMESLRDIIQLESRRQVSLFKLDLRTLYQQNKKSSKSPQKEKGINGRNGGKGCKEELTGIAEALRSRDNATAHEDSEGGRRTHSDPCRESDRQVLIEGVEYF